MAASGGTWVKGKFIPAKQTMAVMFNKQRQTSTKEEKNATVMDLRIILMKLLYKL